MVKYYLGTREIQRAEPEGFPELYFQYCPIWQGNIGKVDSPYQYGSWDYIFPYCQVDEATWVRKHPVDDSVLAALGNTHGQESKNRRVKFPSSRHYIDTLYYY